MRVRCAMDLQLRRAGGRLYVRSPCGLRSYNARLLHDEHLLTLLTTLRDWTPRADVAAWIAGRTGVPAAAARREVGRLLDLGVLVRDSPAQRELFAGRELWHEYGWADAFGYQAATDAIPRVDYGNQDGQRHDVALMRTYTAREEPPALHMAPVSDSTVPLPPPRTVTDVRIADVLAPPDRPPAGGPPPRTLQDLVQVLWFGAGKTGTKKLPVTGEHLRKASPSGGSRHPTEAYVLALGIDGLENGMYHYSVRDHALERITEEIDPEWVEKKVVGVSRWDMASPSAVLILTSRAELSMYRYRESHSYRVLHYDAGHVLETMALVASGMGWRTLRAFSMNEEAVSRALRNDRLLNPALAFMALA
ncbi:SagB/ThcOx family dehydrogenase [Streptomyces lavendulocolor]|uniref:SagB/ThcOx family dehydrogenase n=1 Tax=Streptomyces lavendulocolor TaxID=67316 RepID=UPI0033C1E273